LTHIVLAPAARDFYVAIMKFAAAKLILFALLCSALPGRAQGIQVDQEEFRRLQGEVADLRDAKAADQRRINELSRKIDQLQSALRESNEKHTLKMGDAVTHDDLKKIIEQIVAVDKKRADDREVILEQFDKLAKIVADPRGGNTRPLRVKEKEKEEEKPTQIEGTFIEYKVKDGDIFSVVLQNFNVALKDEGRPTITTSDVKKVNPKVDLNRIRVGQIILLPVPDKKR
jgi:septal ring factor EnvC (AmiA/AmiB activator)